MNVLFALRYFKSKKSTNAINIIAWISVVAIGVGTAALIVVLSVFNGFEGLVKGLYGDFYADIRVGPAHGKVLRLTKEQIASIKQTKGVLQLSLVAEEKAVLTNGDKQAIVFVKGVDDNYTSVDNVGNHIVRGKFETGDVNNPLLVLGSGVGNAVLLDGGESLYPATLYVPNRKAGPGNLQDALNAYNIRATGTFAVQQEFDNKYVFSNLAFMKYMLDMDADEYSSVELKTNDNNSADKIKERLQQLLGKDYVVQTRFQQNQSLYTIMINEKWVIYGILSLILIVAAFNMIGALTMLVLEKQKDIAVLKAMGANNNVVKNIFLSEGLLLAFIGGVGGMLIAIVICWLQQKFHLVPLQGGSFIIDYYPVQMTLSDFLLVGTTVFTVATIAAYLPARKAGRQEFSLKS
jgi:lipoprotein-releasing system permease protein